MVHVASAGGGRHKMLAFESAEPLLRPVDTTSIITVNTIETSSNSSSSSPSPSPSNASVEPVVIVSEVHSRELHIIAEEPTTGNSSPTLLIGQKKNHNNHSSNVGNGIVTQQQQGKMNQNRDGSNGNANFLADTFNSNHNSNMNKQSVKPDGLALISHGLTDSVCESLKLLDNENENVEEGENKVFTEEVVITTIVKKAKTGIMKTTTSHTSSTTTKSEEWHKHDYIMEEGSLNESNDADDLPLLPSGNSSCEAVSSIPTNQFGADPADSSNTGQVAKLSKLGNGSKQVGLKRVSFGSSKTGLVETLVYETPTQEESQNGSAIGGGLGNNDETKAVSINDDDKSGNDAVG
ncbi:hypothetical protein Fcan01_01795 [Folsomia candida]|uniref:Uncharacterized protein n=2 Tax=Folsomia candida TaxID=158441 RepID=A0A226F6C4_FOLCA|nr:hypothetical protein Fcan01_01795 [Folsomia candida]